MSTLDYYISLYRHYKEVKFSQTPNLRAKYNKQLFFTLVLKKVIKAAHLTSLKPGPATRSQLGHEKRRTQLKAARGGSSGSRIWKESECAAQHAQLIHLSEDNGSNQNLWFNLSTSNGSHPMSWRIKTCPRAGCGGKFLPSPI